MTILANKTNFFLHQSLTASHVLNVDTNFYTTLTPAYIAEPSSYLSSTSQTEFITPNTTNDSGNSMITIPDTQNRTFNLTYNFTDGTSLTEAITTTLFDSTEPNESNELYPPNLSSFEYLLENKYRVMFHLNTITQGFAVPIEEVDFRYDPDARLSNGTFTTTVNPPTTVGKATNQTITINNYAGSFIPLGYYDFDISDRNLETLNAPNTLIKHIHQSFVGTNIVDNNAKTISRYRQPYLKLLSRQEFTRREQITRYLYFVKQDYSSAISSITINFHVKTTNFTLGDFFPKNSTTSTTSAPVKAGYNINQQITFTYFISQNNLQEIFTVLTNQTTQMIYEDDFYMEIVNINGSILPYSPSLYFSPFIYIPTVRFSVSSVQVNFEIRMDISVNKNGDNITGFRIKLTHRDGALINYNNFGVGGFSTFSPSSYYTIFTFTGSHFSSQNETLIQLIVGNDNPYEKVYDNETKIEFETFTLASSPTILNNPIINPTFTFNTISTISYEEYSFQTIDDYTETVSMNVYLNTNRDVKTDISFWLGFEGDNGAKIGGSEKFGINTDLWSYTISPAQLNVFGTIFNGFDFVATKIPNIPSNKHLLLTVSYTRYRAKKFNYFQLLPFIRTITPPTNLSPIPDVNHNEIIGKSREAELIVSTTQSLSPNTINVNVNLLCDEARTTYDVVIQIWYDATKLTYTSVSTSYPSTYTDITITPITGTYEGFTQGQEIHMDTPNSGIGEVGSIFNLLQIQLTPVNDYDEIDNNDFAVKFVSTQSIPQTLIEDTIIPLFNYQADVNITGTISEITEGEAYNFTATLNQTNELKFYVYYDIYFNGDVLETNARSFITATLAGVSWNEIRIISNYFYEPNQSTATQNEVFRLKYFREALSDDDFRIVIRTIRLQENPIPTLTFNPTTSVSTFNYFPEFQLRLYSSAVDEDITITVVLEKDNRAVRNFNFNFLVDDDRTINITQPRGGLLDEGTYTLTDQLNVDFSTIGYYTNTNKTLVQYTSTVDGVGLNQPSLEVFYFTIKRRQANYLIDKNDYATEFTFYEAFHTSSPYFNRQNDAEKDDTPYITPQLYLTNVTVSTLSPNNHRLTYTINHPDLGINTTIKFRIFYRNMYIVLNGSPTKTDLSGYNPYETEIGFINGSQFSTIASAGYTTTRYQDFQTDTALADHITHDDFLIVLLDTSSTSQGDYDIPITKYIPSTYVEPSTYNLRTASNRDVFEVSVLNEKNYTTYSGTNITNMRAGVSDFTNNIQISPTNAMISNTWYNLITPSTTPMFQFPITYDYATNGLDVMMTSIFKLNSMNDGEGAILVMGHEDFFQLEIEKSSSPSVDAWGYLKIMGQFYTPGSPRIPITFGEHNAVKIRIVETSTNNFTIDMRHWIVSPSLVEQTPLSFTTTRIVVNPTSTNAIIHKKLGYAPTYVYTVGLTFTYDIEIQQSSYRIGRFTIGEWNDTYFMTQFDSYQGTYSNYAMLDMRKQEAEWETDWDTLQDYGGFGYLYTTIGRSRALALTQDYLFKKNFSTGSTLWGDTMRIGLIIVFRTTTPVEQLCLFLHGEEKSPPNHQLIVNRNGYDDAISIELNENNGSTLQQQHLNKIDWEKPQYEYLYYAKFFKRATPSGSLYEAYDIETKLIGLNNSTNETFTSVGLPQFLKTSSSKSTDFTDNLYIGKTILPNTYGGFAVGYMNYFEYKSDAHSAYEIERVRRDWETIY
jgi:hypothetical protein